MTLQIVQDEAADEVLSTNSFALLAGMLLQQQAPIDIAFAGPAKILDRFGTLDPAAIAEAPAEEFAELCAMEPAVHPYPESMSVLLQALARLIVVNYDGETAALWSTAESGDQLLSRLTKLPGFGRRKAQMFVALLGRQLDVRPPGWERAAGAFAQEGGFRSVADIHDRASLNKVLNVKPGRRTGDSAAEDSRAGETSFPTQESAGLITVSTDDAMAVTADDTTEREEKRAARKAARKVARQAQRRDSRRQDTAAGTAAEGSTTVQEGSADDDAVGDGAEGDTQQKLSPEERAERKARKAEKRTARRVAAGKDPEGRGSRPGRRGGGRRRDLDSTEGSETGNALGLADTADTPSADPAAAGRQEG